MIYNDNNDNKTIHIHFNKSDIGTFLTQIRRRIIFS